MKLARALAALCAAAALALVATPAHAAPPALPAGDTLITLECSSPHLQLIELDSATGAGTPIGEGFTDPDLECPYDPGFDPTTSLIYSTYSSYGSGAVLFSADPRSGDIEVIGPLTGDIVPQQATITVGLDGTIWLLGDGSGALYTVDPDAATVTLVGTIPDFALYSVWGFATDPATGDLYALNAVIGELYLVDPVTVTAEVVATIPFPDGTNFLYGLTIDQAGTAWIISQGTDDDDNYSGLWSTSLAAPGDLESSGILTLDGDRYYSFVIVRVGSTPVAPVAPAAPQLAATGAEVGLVAAGAGMLALAGLALVASRRRAA